MNVNLLFSDDRKSVIRLPFGWEDLTQDLCLESLFSAMAEGDSVIYDSVSNQIFALLTEEPAVIYRQDVMKDTLKNPKAVTKLYDLTGKALAAQKEDSLRFGGALTITQLFVRSKKRMGLLLDALKKIMSLEKQEKEHFVSAGFTQLFDTWEKELGEDFFSGARTLLEELEFPQGMSVEVHTELKGFSDTYRLLRRAENPETGQVFSVADTDRRGRSDLLHRKETALSRTVHELSQAVCNVCRWLETLRRELAFYMGGLHLYRKLTARKLPVVFPAKSSKGWQGKNLYELNTALTAESPVGNALSVEESCILTGADIGGKTTYIKAVAQNQLFFQCGLFVCAENDSAPLVRGVFTHFQREEDPSMVSGKLAEELDRIGGIVDHIHPGSVLFSDESFCSTNEKEGAQMALQVTGALRASGVCVFAVTHLYPFAEHAWKEEREHWTFLCSERLESGKRTFRILPGAPQETAYSADLYREIYKP